MAKIVDHHDLMAIAQQSTDRVLSNVTAAGKANIHQREYRLLRLSAGKLAHVVKFYTLSGVT